MNDEKPKCKDHPDAGIIRVRDRGITTNGQWKCLKCAAKLGYVFVPLVEGELFKP